jgi:hypothetical protein
LARSWLAGLLIGMSASGGEQAGVDQERADAHQDGGGADRSEHCVEVKVGERAVEELVVAGDGLLARREAAAVGGRGPRCGRG